MARRTKHLIKASWNYPEEGSAYWLSASIYKPSDRLFTILLTILLTILFMVPFTILFIALIRIGLSAYWHRYQGIDKVLVLIQ